MDTQQLTWTTDDTSGVLDVDTKFPGPAAENHGLLTGLYRQVWQKFAECILSVDHDGDSVRIEFRPDSGEAHFEPSRKRAAPFRRKAQLNLFLPDLAAAWEDLEAASEEHSSAAWQAVQAVVKAHVGAIRKALSSVESRLRSGGVAEVEVFCFQSAIREWRLSRKASAR
jgi:hypothetical protein